MHRFDQSQHIERRWRPVLAEWLQDSGYVVTDATPEDEWRGIDVWTVDDSGERVGIDFKCDERWRTTGNVFVEVESNHQTGRLGCLLTSEARWILYFLTPDRVLVCLTRVLRAAIPQWRLRYPQRPARNIGYDTIGLLVPVPVVERCAESVSWLSRGDGACLQPWDQHVAT
jgi:hypothetical protein